MVRARLGSPPGLTARIGGRTPVGASLSGVTVVAGAVPVYEGDYQVTPRVDAQVMATRDKRMADDLTVRGIPRYDVSNDVGGVTVSIARTID